MEDDDWVPVGAAAGDSAGTTDNQDEWQPVGQQPAASRAQSSGDDEWQPVGAPEAAGALGTTGREVAHGVLPALASLPFMEAGAVAGTALGGPVGGFVGGAAGAMLGGYLADKVQDSALDAAGMNDREERAANAAAHPVAAEVGRVGSALAAFSPGKLGDSLVQRVLGAGAMTGLEGGQELATEGHLDPLKLAGAAVGGAIFAKPNRVGRAGMELGRPAGEALGAKGRNILGRFREGPADVGVDMPEPVVEPEVDKQQAVGASENPKTSIGIAQEQAPPNEQVTGVGNGNGERDQPSGSDTRMYRKTRAQLREEAAKPDTPRGPSVDDEPTSNGVTMLQEGQVDPQLVAAAGQIKPEAPAVRSNEPAPQPEAAPPPPPQGVPFVVTRAMKAKLAEMGMSPEQVRNLTPQQAHDAINQGRQPGDVAEQPQPVPQNSPPENSNPAPRPAAVNGDASFTQRRLPDEQVAPELARIQREAQANVAQRMAAGQKGEAFTPPVEPVRQDVMPTPAKGEAMPARAPGTDVLPEPAHATEAPAVREPPKRTGRVLEAIDAPPTWEKLPGQIEAERAAAEERAAESAPSQAPGNIEDAKSIKDAAGNHVAYAQSEVLARKQTRALQIAKEIMDKFKPEREFDPNNKADLTAYRARAKEIVEYTAARFKKAAEEEGVKKYMGKKDTTPPEALWLAEQHAVNRGMRKASDGITGERELLKGDKTQVREQRKLEGELNNKRGKEFNKEVTEPGNSDGEGVYHVGRVRPKGAGPDAMRSQEPEKPEPINAAVMQGKSYKPIETRPLKDHMEELSLLDPDRSEIARQIGVLAPNVQVHTLDRSGIRAAGQDMFGYPIDGAYDNVSHSIVVGPSRSPETLLHEGVHAATSRRIDDNPHMRKMIKNVMDQVALSNPDLEVRHKEAFRNEKEFLAYGMTNDKFQRDLINTPVTEQMVNALGLREQAMGQIKNGFQAFVQSVRKILNMRPDQYNALEAVVRLTDMASSVEHAPSKPTFGKRTSTPDAAVRKIRDDADGLLKQKSAPWAMGIRGLNYIARSSDKLFESPEKNPFRRVQGAIERARVKSLYYGKEFSDTIGRKMVDLHESDPAEFAKLEELMAAETRNQRFGDLPLNKQGFNTNDGYKAQRDAAHPELERQWNDLGQEAKDLRDEIYQHTEQRFDEISAATADNRMEKLTGIKDPAMAKRLMEGTHTEADFQKLGTNDRERQSRMEMLQDVLSRSKIEGPYSKEGRRGGHAVIGKYKIVETGNDVQGSPNIEAHEREFKTKADAEDFALQQHGATKVTSYYVDKTTGNRFSTRDTPVLDKKGNETFDDKGNKRMAPKDTAYMKGDPNVEQRWKANVERGYLRMHHTNRDALAHEAQLHKSGDFEKSDVQVRKFKPNIGALEMAGRFTDLENKLKNNTLYQGMSEAQKTSVKELLAEHYLQSLASTHASNSRMKRNYVAGADDNLLKNAFDYARETGDRLSRLEHQPEIDKGMEEAEKVANEHGGEDTSNPIRKVHNEFRSRIESMKDGGFSLASGQMAPGLHRLMSWSYMSRLATPGFTIRNMTQPWLMTGAELAGRHGVGAAYREIGKATKDIGAGSILKGGLKDTVQAAKGKLTDPVTFIEDIKSRLKEPREVELMDRQVKDGATDPDAGFQQPEYVKGITGNKLNMFNARRDSAMTRGAEGAMNAADKALQWMEEVSRSMPRAAETINRATSALAAYRLEYKKLLREGATSAEAHEKAMTYATDVNDYTQFRYTDTNKPAFMRHPLARVAFQFKQFGASTYEFLGRHIGNAIQSQDPELRKASLKSLGVMFVTHTMVAGALGLPWEPVRALLIGAKAAGFTSTEWDDVENGIRETAARIGGDILGQTAGKKAAEAFSRGLPRLLGIDLSPGLGVDNMLLFGSPRSGTDRDMDQNLSAWLFQMTGGAPGGIALQMAHGLRDVMGGDYAGGVEKLMPMKIGSDVLKAEEGYRHGKVDARGRTTVKPYSAYEAGVKAMGLPVGREAEQNEFMHQTFQKGQEVRQGKSEAIKAYITATSPEAKESARKKAMDAGALPKDLTAAVQRANSEKKRIVNGVVTNKDTKPIAERLRNVYEGD